MNIFNNNFIRSERGKKFATSGAIALALLSFFFIALDLRAVPSVINAPYLPQFDSYWFYRYAKMVVDNNGVLPAWDPLSYYPPGRPTDRSTMFYFYTLAYSYMAWHALDPSVTMVQALKWVPAILVSLSVFPAYLIGRHFGGRRSGLLSALFIAVSPAILQRTFADPDNDGSVLFMTLLSLYLLIRLYKQPNIKNLGFAVLGISAFALSWYSFWYVIMIAIGAVVLNFVLSVAYATLKNKKEVIASSIVQLQQRIKYSIGLFIGMVAVPMLFGINTTSAFGWLLSFGSNPVSVASVNVSVAELQRLDIFSLGGWAEILRRTPGLSFLNFLNSVHIQIIFFLFIVAFGVWTTHKRNAYLGSLLLVWFLFTFYAISGGVRFTLLFAPAASIAMGVGLGEIWAIADKRPETFVNKIRRMFGKKVEDSD